MKVLKSVFSREETPCCLYSRIFNFLRIRHLFLLTFQKNNAIIFLVMIMTDIKNEINALEEEIINLRRTLHRHPEFAFCEFKTGEIIKDFLKKHNIDYKDGIAKTGICADIKGAEDGKTILVRADIDALKITEQNDVEYKSENNGFMHACGHDFHIAIALYCAAVIKKIQNEIKGNVRFIFQPAEEETGGALDMINEGVLKNVDTAVGLHVDPETETGKITVKDGEFFASPDFFNAEIIGKGSHGAQPQNAVDPIKILTEILFNIHKNVDSATENEVVMSVCKVNSGFSENSIPDTASFGGTVRAFDNVLRKKADKAIEETIKTACEKAGAKYEYKYTYLYPPLINDKNVTELLIKSAEKAVGKENILTAEKNMLGDDFSYIAENVPSCYFKLGCRNDAEISSNKLHTPNFNPNENAIKIGAEIFVNFILDNL